ncbi:MAG: hypothetical protein MZV63_16505 [Marinilabiliales bacterium]|nr:hypothetical protein [Marinilabiliales bacterium]
MAKRLIATISYPVSYINIPEGQDCLTDNLPTGLILYLKDTDIQYSSLKLSGKGHPVTIDLSKVSYKHDPGKQDQPIIIIVTAQL